MGDELFKMEYELFQVMKKLKKFYEIEFQMKNRCCRVYIKKTQNQLTTDELLEKYNKIDTNMTLCEFFESQSNILIDQYVFNKNFETVYAKLNDLYAKCEED
jgi:hypothetical protein